MDKRKSKATPIFTDLEDNNFRKKMGLPIESDIIAKEPLYSHPTHIEPSNVSNSSKQKVIEAQYPIPVLDDDRPESQKMTDAFMKGQTYKKN